MDSRLITISRCGVARVCSWDDAQIKVNDQDMAELLEKEINLKKPVKCHAEEFAARVTITVELLGDLEESKKEVDG